MITELVQSYRFLVVAVSVITVAVLYLCWLHTRAKMLLRRDYLPEAYRTLTEINGHLRCIFQTLDQTEKPGNRQKTKNHNRVVRRTDSELAKMESESKSES